MFKVLSLFSGIGAFEKALTNLGIEHQLVNYCEIDKYASKAYAHIHNVSEKLNLGDITQVDIQSLPTDVDFVFHVSPCQDFSVAGKQAGGGCGSGTRSSLMWNSVEIIQYVKPKYVIWENVKNLLSAKHRPNFDGYLEVMEEAGYNNYYKVLNAKDYGIPQNRERVYTVSIRKDIDNGKFVFPEPIPLKLRLKDMLDDAVDEKYYLSDSLIKSILDWKAYQKPFERVLGKDSVSPTLTARGAGENHSGMVIYSDKLESTTNLQEELKMIKASESAYGNQRSTIIDKEGLCGSLLASDYKQPLKRQLCNDLIANNKVKENDVIRYSYSTTRMENRDERGVEMNNMSPSLTTRSDTLGVVVNDTPSKTLTNYRIRKLTPKECFRLMGFTDEDFQKAADIPTSNAQLYKMAGNSIVVKVLEHIFSNLLEE